ncbi:MAG TPA: hypothetical protein VE130_03630 [Nitrososphaeraceae archaeon]|nr:hypothetical protein [Nitrososphaeraceae archaeon]
MVVSLDSIGLFFRKGFKAHSQPIVEITRTFCDEQAQEIPSCDRVIVKQESVNRIRLCTILPPNEPLTPKHGEKVNDEAKDFEIA